jgi:hypothetical protein
MKEKIINLMELIYRTNLILDVSYSDCSVDDELGMNVFDFRFIGRRRLDDFRRTRTWRKPL